MIYSQLDVSNLVYSKSQDFPPVQVHEGGFCPEPVERSVRDKVLLLSSHLLLVGPVVRQCQVIKIGLEEMKHPHSCQHNHVATCRSQEYVRLYMKRKYYERDLAYLTMIGRLSVYSTLRQTSLGCPIY